MAAINFNRLPRNDGRGVDLETEPFIPNRLPQYTDEFDFDDNTSTSLQSSNKYQPSPSNFLPLWRALVSWSSGPQPPQIQVICPWYPSYQEAPLRLLNAIFPTRKSQLCLFVLFCLCWALSFSILVRQSRAPIELDEYDKITPSSCVGALWYPKNACGLDGIGCRPFNGTSFAFRCPANCVSVHLLNPRAVGSQEIVYRPLVIGGPVYRGDSFICGAAIHARIITNEGGCGIVSRIGQHREFPSTRHNGITSIGFDSHFPLSFVLQKAKCKVKDSRVPLLIISMGFTTVLSLFTTSPAVFFYTTFTSMFVYVGLVSDPPTTHDLSELISNLVGKFLPAAFCGYAIFGYAVRLQGLKAQIEKTILWLGGCWVGALSNYTFDWIPLARLTSHDLKRQPGGKVALAVVVVSLACIVAQQVYYFRLEGRLRRYLALYGVFIGAILLLVAEPGMNVRIHHYILALLLLPGTSLQTRSSLLYQGILVGLFINGVARWGFDPVLQTNGALRGDGQFSSALPSIRNPAIALGAASNITFSWDFPPSLSIASSVPHKFDGISILVNDVERYRRYADQEMETPKYFTWTRHFDCPEYFRFGYLKGNTAFDYTKAGIWAANGSWIDMEPGPS